MSKSVTNALIGILVARGTIEIARPIPVPEWGPDDPRRAITWRHMLHMSSGLDFVEVYEPGTDVAGLLFREHSAGAFMAGKTLGKQPDTHWYYSSGTTNLISLAMRQLLGDDTYARFPREALFNRISMATAIMEPDPSGSFICSSFTYASARDWARLGLLYYRDGVWQGERVLPKGWVDFTRKAAPAAPNGNYGAHFWLNLGSDEAGTDRPWPTLPRDTYAMDGFEGQHVVIVPSRKLVAVRLGQTPRNGFFDFEKWLAGLLAALPEG